MTVKAETLKFGEREVKFKELGFLAHVRLSDLKTKLSVEGKKPTFLDTLKESVSEEDFKFLEELTSEEFDKVFECVYSLNGWGTKAGEAKDFQEASSEANTSSKPTS